MSTNNIRCSLGLHSLQIMGRMHNGCKRCKAEWYTDYSRSRAAGVPVRFKVRDNDGHALPEMKRWEPDIKPAREVYKP